MATPQTMKKTCSILMIVAIFMMMFSAQISHSMNVEMCVKHCIPNQCMKVVKNPDPAMCEEACKKLCKSQLNGRQEYLVPPKEGRGTTIGNAICQFFKNGKCP
ncbi:hypothetical protein EUTSA_v10009885mg [Eutrema salsugineum]|uniref:Plant thionin family protein n=1 Tax=Eutrema salsugineum TaxID=72664 RepID=V4KX39_EUTSA|nr:uncharacterized protein LOC18992760 [Eutrema salsugineum]ESQ34612.1 hypothetical protein EUTSA_v10009885mg [Eutrema salsugineum]